MTRILTPEQRARKNECERARRRAAPESNRETVREWRAKNGERKALVDARWRSENAEAMRAARAAWKRANPDKLRAYKHKRRDAAVGSLSGDLVERLLRLQRNRCANCAADLRRTGNHIDHVVPLARGGGNTDDNAQLLCPPCNTRKRDADPIEFAQRQGRLL